MNAGKDNTGIRRHEDDDSDQADWSCNDECGFVFDAAERHGHRRVE